ncbi:hypothetical protein SAMN04487895_11218 [Paenibacillus sophorae]|uniref:Uncharacterized protein n=1 Tax=Paenibacillus sophorae TaxID=1333845 RepID=A0A1H8SNN7_9BACL|nr:hypothetical protein [Paenibacillus sophorae]QWU15483.1 hypothetical protein KP014_27125 [Paenibacillus sophorae]SEO79793.1 hypothetical protein SAMN04487895_11218 [Paenibacillus sophorae]
MKSGIRYLLDYGEYYDILEFAGDEEKMDNGEGKHAASNGQDGIREEGAAYDDSADDGSASHNDKSVSQMPTIPLFWSFPRGRGVRQPWRSRLWEHQRDQL